MTESTKISLTELAKNTSVTERSINAKREDARAGIAYLIIGCFSVVIVASFLLFFYRGETPVDDVLKIVQAVIAPVIGIVGAVTGFYFSSSASETAAPPVKPPSDQAN